MKVVLKTTMKVKSFGSATTVERCTTVAKSPRSLRFQEKGNLDQEKRTVIRTASVLSAEAEPLELGALIP